jgi:hypothetical protein
MSPSRAFYTPISIAQKPFSISIHFESIDVYALGNRGAPYFLGWQNVQGSVGSGQIQRSFF